MIRSSRSNVRIIESSDSGSLNLCFDSRSPEGGLSSDLSLNSRPADSILSSQSGSSKLGFHSRSPKSILSGNSVSFDLSSNSGSSEGGFGLQSRGGKFCS